MNFTFVWIVHNGIFLSDWFALFTNWINWNEIKKGIAPINNKYKQFLTNSRKLIEFREELRQNTFIGNDYHGVGARDAIRTQQKYEEQLKCATFDL